MVNIYEGPELEKVISEKEIEKRTEGMRAVYLGKGITGTAV